MKYQKKAPAGVMPISEDKVTLTSDEAAIVSRIMADSKGWGDVKESDVDDYALANDPMEIPEPAKEMERKKMFKHRWIARRPERLDEMRNKVAFLRWDVCNAVTAPYLKGFFDPILGCVPKLDQMLVHKPWRVWEMEQRYKHQLAEGKDASGDIAKKHGTQKDGATYIAGKPVSAGDRIVADETIDTRIDNYAEAAEA